jgi:hypothetical protein
LCILKHADKPSQHFFIDDWTGASNISLLLQDLWRTESSTSSNSSPTKQTLPNQALPSLAAKRKAASHFIRDCTGVSPPFATDQVFRAALKDGVLLCKVVNTVWPEAVKQVRPQTAWTGCLRWPAWFVLCLCEQKPSSTAAGAFARPARRFWLCWPAL